MRTRAPATEMHWTTRIGVGGAMLLALTIAALNVYGWFSSLPIETAAPVALVALSLEAMAFVLWEHIARYTRERRWPQLALAALGLLFAVAINIEGGHRGLIAIAGPLYANAEADRRHAQAGLDAERAQVQSEIARLQQRVDAAAPDCSAVGPETCRARTEAWQNITASDRAAITAQRARLDVLPLTIARAEPFPAWGPYAVTSALAFLAVFGLTMFGVRVETAPRIIKTAPKPRRSAAVIRLVGGVAAAGALAGAADARVPSEPARLEASEPGALALARSNTEDADVRKLARQRIIAGESPTAVARDLGLPPGTCKRWACSPAIKALIARARRGAA